MGATRRAAPDLTTQKFTRLTVIARDPERSRRHHGAYYECLCDCGATVYASGQMLRSGRHKSCGCLKRERMIARSTRHGHAVPGKRSSTYESWRNMTRRCNDPGHPRYADWGGRGITVDPRWADFANFLADMGEKPPGLTLERKDNDGPYNAENCCWDTYHAQRVNRRHWLTPDLGQEILDLRGQGATLHAIGTRMGVSRSAIRRALLSLQP